MAAPKGNAFFMKRSKHGRGQMFSAESLSAACDEYVQWVKDNPLMEQKLASHQGVHELVPVPHMRAMTIDGLTIFLGVTDQTWRAWRDGDDEDKSRVCREVEKTIRDQKFTGAAGGFLNAAIIARDLGLADKREFSGPDGGPIQTTNTELSKDELDAELKKRGLPLSMFEDDEEGEE